mmetsp:Transcript_43647/g.138354  ORF Transcript_43647/g.138354 Transcript_43647/m.138354 type:complete len:240 (-) Transcript_43647:89-808(-)
MPLLNEDMARLARWPHPHCTRRSGHRPLPGQQVLARLPLRLQLRGLVRVRLQAGPLLPRAGRRQWWLRRMLALRRSCWAVGLLQCPAFRTQLAPSAVRVGLHRRLRRGAAAAVASPSSPPPSLSSPRQQLEALVGPTWQRPPRRRCLSRCLRLRRLRRRRGRRCCRAWRRRRCCRSSRGLQRRMRAPRRRSGRLGCWGARASPSIRYVGRAVLLPLGRRRRRLHRAGSLPGCLEAWRNV